MSETDWWEKREPIVFRPYLLYAPGHGYRVRGYNVYLPDHLSQEQQAAREARARAAALEVWRSEHGDRPTPPDEVFEVFNKGFRLRDVRWKPPSTGYPNLDAMIDLIEALTNGPTEPVQPAPLTSPADLSQ